MRLEFSAAADRDYHEIIRYSVAKFGAETASEYEIALQVVFSRLCAYPKSGRAEPDLQYQIRSIACESHRIYYEIGDNQIVIRRILHKTMDAGRQPI